jgi:hypothetical protein
MSTPTSKYKGGYSEKGFTRIGYTHGLNSSTIQDTPTWLNQYYQPYRAKLEIFDINGFNLLAKYDSFASDLETNDFHLVYLECEPTVGNNSTGTWGCLIEDNQGVIDRKKIGISNRVKISMGQTGGSGYKTIFQGVCRYDETDTSKTDWMRIKMTGFGTQYITNERLINYHKVAARNDLLSADPFVFDPNMTASALAKAILNNTNVLASNSGGTRFDTVAEVGQYTTNGIESIANFIPGISFPFTPVSTAFNQLSDTVGAEWGVDALNDFYFRFPSSQITKNIMTIKALPDFERDSSTMTAYMQKGATVTVGRTMRREDGFANKLFALAGNRQVLESSSAGATNSTTLSGKAIAQQIIAGSTLLRDLALTLSKAGKVTGFLQGKIVVDNNNSPTGSTIANFQIDMNDIPLDVAGPVYKLNTNFLGKISPNQLYWIVLYSVGQDENNTVRWHNDGITDDDTKTLASGFRTPGNKVGDDEREQGWTVSTSGPTYSYAAFATQRHIVVVSDPFSIARFGEVDDIITNTAIKDAQTMTQYLYNLLVYTAKPKLIYPTLTVSIPLGGFVPGQLIQIIDRKAGLTEEINRLAELISVRYVWDSSASDSHKHAVGINTCDITLIGYYDFVREEAIEPI